MLNFNSKIKINEEFSIIEEAYQTYISNGDKKEPLSATEKMIINHHQNFRLKEICIILQEFFQIDHDESISVVNKFVHKFLEKNMINVVDIDERYSIDEDSVIIQNTKIDLIEDADNTGVLRDIKLGKMIYINKSGIEIWKYMNEKRTASQVIKDISKLYNVKYEDIKDDILSFLFTLLEKDFVCLTE